MAIQIIDNFQVNVADALDNRLVVGPNQFYTDKDDLPYKYAGMRVWDLNTGLSGVPYVWNGTTFETESSSGIAGSGTPGTIPKFVGGGNQLANSIITEVGSFVGIGMVGGLDAALHVNGKIQSDGTEGFYGIGTFISNINAGNITTGTLELLYLENGSLDEVLKAGNGEPEWVTQSSLSVGNSINASNIYHSVDTSTTTYRPLTFIDSSSLTGTNQVKTSADLTFTPRHITTFLPFGGKSGLQLNGYMGINTAPSVPTIPIAAADNIRLNVNGAINSSQVFTVQSNATTALSSYLALSTSGTALPTTFTNDTTRNLSVLGTSYFTGQMFHTTDALLRRIQTIKITLGSSIYTNPPSLNPGSGGTLTLSKSGSHYLKIESTSALVGVWFKNPTRQSSLYMESNGRLVCGGLGGTQRFTNFYLQDTPLNRIYLGRNDIGTGLSGTIQVVSGGGGFGDNGAAFRPSSNTNWIIGFSNTAAAQRGRIEGGVVSSNSVRYTTTSDRRLKENIKDMDSMIDIIKKIKPVSFSWKDVDMSENVVHDTKDYGFIAQDIYKLLPNLRNNFSEYCDYKDPNFDIDNPIDKKGNPFYYAIDYGTITPYLTKALQETILKLEDLTDKIKNASSLEDLKDSL